MKAKKLHTIYDKYSNHVFYEYKGHKYEVEYPNSFTYCCTSPRVQHENAQSRIDMIIESESKSNHDQTLIDWDEIWNMFEI